MPHWKHWHSVKYCWVNEGVAATHITLLVFWCHVKLVFFWRTSPSLPNPKLSHPGNGTIPFQLSGFGSLNYFILGSLPQNQTATKSYSGRLQHSPFKFPLLPPYFAYIMLSPNKSSFQMIWFQNVFGSSLASTPYRAVWGIFLKLCFAHIILLPIETKAISKLSSNSKNKIHTLYTI